MSPCLKLQYLCRALRRSRRYTFARKRRANLCLTEMSQKSDCVLVGRCADYILKDKNPLKIFVYADMASKIARCRLKAPENEHLSDHEMRKQIKRIDRNRAKYYEFYTGRKWGDKLNYDLCINTTNTEIKKIVPRIAKLF